MCHFFRLSYVFVCLWLVGDFAVSAGAEATWQVQTPSPQTVVVQGPSSSSATKTIRIKYVFWGVAVAGEDTTHNVFLHPLLLSGP